MELINTQGIIIGIITFMLIGVFHVVVIKAEYYFGKNIWPLFLLAGCICAGASLFIENIVISSCISIFGITCIWSILELFHQEKRVEKGQFPKNPKRKYKN